MKIWVPAALWLFVAVPWFLLDGWLADLLGDHRVDLTLALCLAATLALRASVLPWVLVCAAFGRAVVYGGAPAQHLVLIGLPVAVLFPLRRLAAHRGSVAWHVALTTVLALVVARLGTWLEKFGTGPPLVEPLEVWSVCWAAITVPFAAWLLSRLPPLWFFRER